MTAEKTATKTTPQTRANRLRGLELAVQMNAQREYQYAPGDVLKIADGFADYLHTGAIPSEDAPL